MEIKIKVVPNSKKDEIIEDNPLVVRVTDPPEKNKANRKVIKLLSKYFKNKVSIVSGLKSKEKIISVEDNK